MDWSISEDAKRLLSFFNGLTEQTTLEELEQTLLDHNVSPELMEKFRDRKTNPNSVIIILTFLRHVIPSMFPGLTYSEVSH